MSKIYLGTNEVANTGGGGGGDYVLNSSYDEMTRVAASALVELKAGKADKADVPTIDDMSNVKNDVSSLKSGKADASTVYSKSDIDNSNKVVAAALASQDARITQLDASVNALEQGGGGITPAQLDASLKAYTYDKKWLDASISSIEPGVSFAQLDASLKAYTYNKAFIDASYGYIDTSIKALDASALYFDASIREIALQGGGGGSADLTNYYNKQQIDASYGVIDSSLKSFDASIKELATSGGGGGSAPDLTNYATKSDISTFKPIVYTTKDDYDEDVSEGTIDPDAMYVITDLASTDELSNIVTIDNLNAEKERINDSLNETADAIISAANTSCGYWKDQNVSQCQSQCTTAKNTAVSAVQSQQTTSVNAVNTAKNTAINDINTAMAQMKSFVVITEADYAEITPDANTIYFITD